MWRVGSAGLLRRLPLLLLAACLPLLQACGPAQPGRWSVDLAWRTAIAVAGQPEHETGPLALAAGDATLVLADSFAHRLLIWRASGATWQGPTRVTLPTSQPIIQVAAGPAAGAPVYAATASGGIWEVGDGSAPRRLARFAGGSGDLRRVVGMVAGARGLWVEVVSVRADATTRELAAVDTSGVRLLQRAVLASAGPARDIPPAWLYSPAGVRISLAVGPQGSYWLVGRDPHGAPALLRLGPAGAPDARRRWPEDLSRADFLGVAPSGMGYVLVDAGSERQHLESLTPRGTVRRARAFPAGEGPRLPHPAAMAPDGALAVLTALPGALRIDWYPPKAVWGGTSG